MEKNERLTKLKHYGDYAVRHGAWFEWNTKCGKLVTMPELNKLAEYENTALSPAEVEQLKADLAAYRALGTPEEIKAKLEESMNLIREGAERIEELEENCPYYEKNDKNKEKQS